MLGKMVTYNGFITLKSGHTVKAVLKEMCIGYDEDTIYTKIVSPRSDYYSKWPKWDDVFEMSKVQRQFRIGFHRSRLIQVHEPAASLPIGFPLQQLSLF